MSGFYRTAAFCDADGVLKRPVVTSPALLSELLLYAVAAYGLALVLCFAQLSLARGVLGAGLALHLVWLVWRGVLIGYLPMTNKTESFAAASFCLALVLLILWKPVRAFVAPQLAIVLAAGVTAALFPQELKEPGALLRTIWYPLHVPLSFVAMGFWVSSAAAGLCWAIDKDRTWLQRTDHLALQGLGLWSASMIFGGIWGVVAWGAYFMWDPKMLWSVILWFHYSAFVHVRLTPSLQSRAWVRPALAGLGVAWMFVAYVGTSFFFGKSSHAF